MRPSLLLCIGLTFLLHSCKNDKPLNSDSSDSFITSDDAEVESPTSQTRVLSKMLYARLDRLKIRTDSTMGASTATIISEGDTLIFQDKFSTHRENLKLRGKNYYEPWLKVLHPKSGKTGWVYGGAVIYDSKELKLQHDKASPLLAQVYADDLEWDGTVPTGWAAATIKDPEEFKLFLIRFKSMVATNDVDKIANLVRYPLKDIKDKADFKANFARLISDDIKDAVAEQRLDRIFRNSQGAMIGNGEIWFKQIGSNYKITAINFKGRSDLTKDLMVQLSGNYVTDSPSGKQSIKAFTIKKFLELTLNYQGQNGFPESRSLGRFLHETSHNGRHSFYQDTKDSVQRRLLFEVQDSISVLTISKDGALEDLQFIN